MMDSMNYCSPFTTSGIQKCRDLLVSQPRSTEPGREINVSQPCCCSPSSHTVWDTVRPLWAAWYVLGDTACCCNSGVDNRFPFLWERGRNKTKQTETLWDASALCIDLRVSVLFDFLEIPGMRFAFFLPLIRIIESLLFSSLEYNPLQFTVSKNPSFNVYFPIISFSKQSWTLGQINHGLYICSDVRTALILGITMEHLSMFDFFLSFYIFPSPCSFPHIFFLCHV